MRTIKGRSLFIAFAVCAGAVLAEVPQTWRVVPRVRSQTRQVPLPPLAQVTATDPSGQTWRQSGEIGGSVEGAGRAFEQVFRANGWQVNKRIAMGRLKDRSQILVLTRPKRRVLVLVWAKEAGLCGFAWGEEQ